MKDIYRPGEVSVALPESQTMRMRESFVAFAGLREQSLATYVRRYPEISTLEGIFAFTDPYGDTITFANASIPLRDHHVGLVTVAMDAQNNVIGLETTGIMPATGFNAVVRGTPDTAIRQSFVTASNGYATALAIVHEEGLRAYATDRQRAMVVSGDEISRYPEQRRQYGQLALDEAQAHYRDVTDDAYWEENGTGRYHYTGRRDHAFAGEKTLVGMALYREDVIAAAHRQLVRADSARDRVLADNERFAELARRFELTSTKTIQPTDAPVRRGRVARHDFELELQAVEVSSHVTIEDVSAALQRAYRYDEQIVADN